jgi:chromosomal replication initiator protein DnaA
VDLNPRYRFETFVVGPSNRLAAVAAQAVAAHPGTAYNPLFIYGRSGLGKTHLLHAIGFGARDRTTGLTVLYLTLEEVVERFHAAVAAGHSDAFRKSVGETDVLLLDDVQFLAKHREMQAELLRLCETVQAANRQIALTSDRPPAEIEELDERLISRLSGGLLVDLAPPDFETRLAILRRKTEERGAQFQPGVLDTVAEIGATNVRELIGLVNRLIAFQAVSEVPLTPAGARALLEDSEPEGEAAAVAPPAPAPAPAAAPARDEFSAFLSAVSRTVAQSLDAWRSRVGEAVMRWQGEGFRTARLEALLQQDSLPDVEEVLARFEADCAALQQLAAEVEQWDPQAAGHPRFRDPDQVEEVRGYVRRMREGMVPPPAPSTALTFDDYVTGTANEAVVRAARLIIAEPGRRYNPLYIVGPSGVGKSHLLHAIGNALLAGGSAPRVACLTAPAFTEDLLSALEGGNVEWWRRRYRGVDAFLLDDVQLIAGKEQTQDELFNLFNALAESEKQLVFAADRPPTDLQGVATRLVTRFEGGLVVELTAPDRAMREILVQRLLAQQGVAAEDEVVQYLAARPADSARAVQGIVNRALSAMDGGEERLTLTAARRAVEGRTARPSQARAISATIPSGLDAALASREKVVWDWPEIGDRLLEELR